MPNSVASSRLVVHDHWLRLQHRPADAQAHHLRLHPQHLPEVLRYIVVGTDDLGHGGPLARHDQHVWPHLPCDHVLQLRPSCMHEFILLLSRGLRASLRFSAMAMSGPEQTCMLKTLDIVILDNVN